MVLVDLRRLTPGVGSGSVGTNATGLFTLRPDFVRVGSGVYEDEISESSYRMSERRCRKVDVKSITYITVHALSPLPLSTSSATSSPSPSPPRAPSRRGRRARRASASLRLQRRPYSPTSSSSPPGIRNWRRRRQLIARNIILQHLRSLSLEGRRPCRIFLTRLQSLQDLRCGR